MTDIGPEFLREKEDVLHDHEEKVRASLRAQRIEIDGWERPNESMDVAATDWNECVRMEGSSGGSGGVVFCSWSSGAKAVLKGTTETSREVFATRVLRRLGVFAPHVRLIQFSDLEYAHVKEAVARLCSGELLYRVQKNLKRPQILLFEFVAGSSPLEGASLSSASIMEQLGRMTAVDVALNNLDRLPLGVWGNEGNLGNVLITKSNHCIAIDTATFGIRKEISGRVNVQYDRYRNSIVALARDSSDSISIMRDKCRDCWGVQLGDAEAFARGLQSMMRQLIQLPENWFATEKETVSKLVSEDWENVWQHDVASINVEFINDMIDAMREGQA